MLRNVSTTRETTPLISNVLAALLKKHSCSFKNRLDFHLLFLFLSSNFLRFFFFIYTMGAAFVCKRNATFGCLVPEFLTPCRRIFPIQWDCKTFFTGGMKFKFGIFFFIIKSAGKNFTFNVLTSF